MIYFRNVVVVVMSLKRTTADTNGGPTGGKSSSSPYAFVLVGWLSYKTMSSTDFFSL